MSDVKAIKESEFTNNLMSRAGNMDWIGQYIPQSYNSSQLLDELRNGSQSHAQVAQPPVIDPFCTSLNTDNVTQICYASGIYKAFQTDYVYTRSDLQAIIFNDTQIVCKSIQYGACAITIRLVANSSFNQTAIRFLSSSYIQASKIFIQGVNTLLEIDGTSLLQTTGRSLQTKGTDITGKQGASYIGYGGSCTNQSNTRYGSFNMKPNPLNIYDMQTMNLIGSMGQSSGQTRDLSTGGGGHINLAVDSLVLRSGASVEANGAPNQNKPDSDDLNAGSGGYIFINTSNIRNNNTIESFANFSAIGGFGKNNGVGGAGGTIVLSGNFSYNYSQSQLNFFTNGGGGGSKYNPVTQPCATGASGTLFFEQTDSLILNNRGSQTNKTTSSVAILTRDPINYASQIMVAKNISIQNGANLEITQSRPAYILFPNIEIYNNSSLYFNVGATSNLIINYTESFYVAPDSSIDFTRVINNTSIQAGTLPNSTWVRNNEVTLGITYFRRRLSIEVDTLKIQAAITDPFYKALEPKNINATFSAYTNYLWIMGGSSINTHRILLFANKTLAIQENSVLNSLIKNECNLQASGNLGIYKCMNYQYGGSNLSLPYILDFYNKQYQIMPNDAAYAQRVPDMEGNILQKWNVYLISLGDLLLNDSYIKGPRVGLCGSSISSKNSLIDASAKGCPNDAGLGAGVKVTGCAGSGASHGGDGGYGGSEKADDLTQKQCLKSFPAAYYFGKEALFEGSGGASGDTKKTTGGSGGGMVWLATPGTLLLRNSTKVVADGSSGRVDEIDQDGSGGGSGGSISITTLNLQGDGLLSAQGGTGSNNGGGGGAGGRLVVYFLKGYVNSSQPAQSYFWDGVADVQGGNRGQMSFKFQAPTDGQTGTIYHTKCLPGYSGAFCSPCEVGRYKTDYSFGSCLPCKNAPFWSAYTQTAVSTSLCPYQCFRYLEKAETNPDCLDPASLQVQRIGGLIPFFSVVIIFIVLSVTIFVALQCRAQINKIKIKSHPLNLYQVWEANDNNEAGMISSDDMCLKDSNIWSHSHRMYLIGYNSIKFPWFIAKDIPRDALKKADREKFLQFIDEQNPKLKFSALEKWSFVFIKLFYAPAAKAYHLRLRRNKFIALRTALLLAFPPQFFSDKGDNKTLRLSCSKLDYQLAYIDFIDYSKSKDNWLGLKLPLPILLAGSGTYNHPYMLDFIEDTIAKSLVLIDFEYFKDKLPVFLENFNSQLSKLSFYKLEIQTIRDLSKTVRWIEQANSAMFNHFGIKCVFYIIENQYSATNDNDFKQKRRSFPLESIFFEAFPEMYKALLHYLKQKLISKKSEIRLALVFKKYTKVKRIKTEMRINLMKQEKGNDAYKAAINREESVLFDETDQDAEDEKLSYSIRSRSSTTTPNPNFSNILSNASSLNSSQTLTSMVQMHLDPSKKMKPIKLVDKTKRAFSISIDSSKAFELAIRKPRNKCKHYVTAIRSSIYGIYLLLMKHHGSPPETDELTSVFVLYAAFLSVDILLLIHYTLHIFTPARNFLRFGWAFFFIFFAIPYLSPLLALIAAIKGSDQLLKTTGNMNSMMICFNIPLTVYLSWIKKDDTVYLLILAGMVAIKILISGISAKVRMYLINPRYSKNREKLDKILTRQNTKLKIRDEIFTGETGKIDNQVNTVDADTDLSVFTSLSSFDHALDQDKMREKLLE